MIDGAYLLHASKQLQDLASARECSFPELENLIWFYAQELMLLILTSATVGE